MLFNSYQFIFIFLPLVLIAFRLLKVRYRLGFLVLASILFYSVWSLEHLGLLLTSVGVNYWFAKKIGCGALAPPSFAFQKGEAKATHPRGFWLGVAIMANLLPLLYFKYTLVQGTGVLLPLAISFYTFQQIAFLVDVYQGKVRLESFSKYLFFVLFFPQLIAGPIVHYQDLLTQVERGALRNRAMMGSGVMLFCIGLFKKVVLADSVMAIANGAFGHIDTLSSLEAWVGIVAYSLGIYFDFSAYSDMAIGLGLLFGIVLPVNFRSPYKATNIVDFWRRWHITLSEFLKYYIYIPLGGNRHGRSREVASLLLTMSIGGIWHGVGWTFLLWGFGHGVLLILVHFWRTSEVRRRIMHSSYFTTHYASSDPFKSFKIFFTFVMVTLLWVLFRANSLDEAIIYYGVLFSFDGRVLFSTQQLWILGGLIIVWFMPNGKEIIDYGTFKKLKWYHALFASLLSFIALKMMATAPAMSFVYFNF